MRNSTLNLRRFLAGAVKTSQLTQAVKISQHSYILDDRKKFQF